MTKPTIKLSSNSFSQVTRPKTKFLIHKKSHPKLYQASHNSDCSPYLILTLARNNAQKNPQVLSLFKNSKKNAQNLDDLAEIASTIEQTSNPLDTLPSVLQNVEGTMNEAEQGLDFLIQSQKQSEASNTNPLSLFSDNELEVVLQNLGEDFFSQNVE